jgi:hypothetical protein
MLDSRRSKEMALIVAFRNISALADISDYEVTVLINDHIIAKDKVEGHLRSDGWRELVRKLGEKKDE